MNKVFLQVLEFDLEMKRLEERGSIFGWVDPRKVVAFISIKKQPFF